MQSGKEVLQADLVATEKELEAIARKLHDGMNQALAVCKQLMETKVHRNGEAPGLLTVQGHLQQVIDAIRGTAHQLAPSDLGKEGVYAAVKEMVAKIELFDNCPPSNTSKDGWDMEVFT